jgi:ParB family chromosome partitioning protein
VFRTIKLSQLRQAPANVRRVPPSAEGIDQLAASIAAKGVIQNLVAYKEGRHFHVFAGGRRLRALDKLLEAGAIDGNYEVPVSERSKAEAVEISLSENEQREAMHPADSVRAFALLRDENGWGAADIAARFGYEEGHVSRLMALGSLAPELLDEMGEDRLSIPTARALCLTDDHVRQIEVYNQHGDNPHRIRAALTGEKIGTDSSLFKFVGFEAYAEAGGTFTQDLFAKEDGGYADDVALVEALAQAKLTTVGDELRAMGWKEVQVETGRPDNFWSLPRLQPQRREPNEAEAARIEAITTQISDLEDADPESEDLEELHDQLDTIEDGLLCFPAEVRAQHKALAFIGHGGELEVTNVALRSQTEVKPVKPAEGPYSKGLVEQLTGIRSLALQMAVAADPTLALDVLLDSLTAQLVHHDYGWNLVAQLGPITHAPNVDDDLLANSAITRVTDAIPARFADIPAENRFETIRAMAQETKLTLLASLVASTISATQHNGGGDEDRMRTADRYAEAAGLDLTALWTPGVETFGRIRKAGLLTILRDTCGEGAAENCAKMKGEELARTIGERLPHGWLPAPMLPLPAKAGTPTEPEIIEDAFDEAA